MIFLDVNGKKSLLQPGITLRQNIILISPPKIYIYVTLIGTSLYLLMYMYNVFGKKITLQPGITLRQNDILISLSKMYIYVTLIGTSLAYDVRMFEVTEVRNMSAF